MKNKLLFASILMMVPVVALSSCGPDQIIQNKVSISVNGSASIDMNTETLLTAVVENLDQYTIVWSSSNPEVASVNQSGIVTAHSVTQDTKVTITATIEGQSDVKFDFELTVKFVESSDDIYVKQITMNKNFVDYYTNKGENTQNIEQQFQVMNKDYLVGDDNFIDFKPVTKFMKFNSVGELEDFNYKGEWIYDLTISVKNDDDTYSVVDNPSTLIDSVDYVHCKVDFSEEAIGKTFKVKVEPGKLTQNQKNDADYDSYYVVNYDVVITDGFNVYDSKELCYIDNRTDEYGVAWNAYKEANGLSTTYHPSNLILHSNITLTLDNLPDIFYYDTTDIDFPTDAEEAARVNHSMRDWVSIYYRYLDRNSSFNIFGNYFTLDASSLPVILYEENEPTDPKGLIISNSELMTIEASVHSTSENTDAPTSLFKDFYIKGNASRTEDSTKGGGLIFTKHNSVKTTYDNVISRSWYITFFSEDNIYDEYVVQNSKAYDSYSNFMYVWGSSNVLLKDSYFSGWGVPAIIADDVTSNGTGHRPSNVKIENSDIIANVAGTEGWFQGYGAVSAAGQIKSLSDLLIPFGKTFTRTTKADTETTYFNFICLHKDGSNAGMTSSSIYGSLTIDNNESFMLANSSDPTFAGLYAQSVAHSFPILKSSLGGYGFFNGTNLSDAAGNNLTTPEHALDTIYQGDYIALYFQGMMITMGYYAAGSTID